MRLPSKPLDAVRGAVSPRARWLAAGLALMLVFLNVWAHARVDRLQVDLDRESKRQRQLQSRIQFLGNEVRRGSTLSEVERRAVGMTTPAPEAITVLHLEPAEDGLPAWDGIVPAANAATRGQEPGEGR